LSPRLLPKDGKIKIYKTIMSSVGCGYETWSISLREENRLRMHENKVVRRKSGLVRDVVMRGRRQLNNESSIICTPHEILLG
jgi:hypothetical protein